VFGAKHPAVTILVASLVHVLAWGLLGLGLLSPLTPSYSTPSFAALCAFGLLPVGALSYLAFRFEAGIARFLIVVEVLAMIAIVFYLAVTISDPGLVR
jgi:hypothetical protein